MTPPFRLGPLKATDPINTTAIIDAASERVVTFQRFEGADERLLTAYVIAALTRQVSAL